MSVLNIRQAQREGARLVIGLSAISGGGKTYTALQLAYGLAGYDAMKVGLIDAENRRGSLYADAIKDSHGNVQPFLIGDLDAPFSPERYIQAIQEFQNAGVEVLVIDSVSHEWEGIGGCEEIAERMGRNGNKNWAAGKSEHKKFMNVLLASNMHVIACIRAREKVKHEKVNGKTDVIPLGILPVCEKNFMFELTASMMLWDGGKQRDVMKSSGIESILGAVGLVNGYLTPAHGYAIRQWVDGAKQLDADVEAARNKLRSISEQGMEAYRAEWPKLPKKIQKALTMDGSHDRLKAAAEAFDKQRAQAKPGGEALASVNAELDAQDGHAGAFE